MTTILDQLNNAPAWENPAYTLACEIAAMQDAGASWADVKAIGKQIDDAITKGRSEDRAIAEALAVLAEAEAVALATVPLGF